MLENGLNQGAGLRRIAPRTPLRLVAMASHGDQDSELPLLWSLCSTWIGLGYPVVVLDVTASESHDNPGLQQLLDGTFWNDSVPGATAWAILPAARGMARWHRQGRKDRSPIELLPDLLPQFEIVLIYAHTELIASLFRGSGVMPLVALSPQAQALLTAYQSTKLLLLNAHLEPTIVSVVSETDRDTPPGSGQQMSKNLQECAMNFLGHRITALTADASPARAHNPSDAMKGLALRLLENAAVVERAFAPRPPTHKGSRRAAARSH